MNISSGYLDNGKSIYFEKLIKQDYPDLKASIIRVVPKMKGKMEAIRSFILDIPTEYSKIAVMSSERKEFYIKGLEYRLNEIFNSCF